MIGTITSTLIYRRKLQGSATDITNGIEFIMKELFNPTAARRLEVWTTQTIILAFSMDEDACVELIFYPISLIRLWSLGTLTMRTIWILRNINCNGFRTSNQRLNHLALQ